MAIIQFKLVDEMGKAKDVKGFVDAHPDGVYISFHGDELMDPRVGVQLFNGKLSVFVFSIGQQEEPTHQITLDLPVSGTKEWRPRRS